MNESRNIFWNRIEKTHIQRDEINEFYRLCQERKAFSGIEKEEFETLINDLNNDQIEHSNDMVVDMIIHDIMEYTKDFKLKKILENINIANITNDNLIIGKAYPKYYDGSYYIEIGKDIEKVIMILSDLFAVFFMYKKDIESIEKSLLDQLLYASTQRLDTNEDYNESYNLVQIKMMIFDRMVGNDDFTNNYVAYAREIYEVAMAFFIGHEIGHHYYEHTNPNVKSSQDAKIKEYMADDYGMNLAITYLQSSYPNDANRYGIHQFAGIYIPLIASSYFCNDILSDGKTHPAIIKRLCEIQKKLGMKIETKAYQEVESYIGKLYETIKFYNKISE